MPERLWYDIGVVAFYLPGGEPVYVFSLLLGIGASCGLACSAWLENAAGRLALPTVNAGIWILVGGLVGGRAVYVAVNWPYYQLHPGEAVNVSQGGLAWPGALSGAVILLTFYAYLAHRPLPLLADACLPLAGLLAVTAWLGCWLDGCAYGNLTSHGWGLLAADEWGLVERRVPVQCLAALWVLLLTCYVQVAIHPQRPGKRAGIWLCVFCLSQFALGLLRADPAPRWQGIRLDAWFALAGAFLTLAGWLLLPERSKLARD